MVNRAWSPFLMDRRSNKLELLELMNDSKGALLRKVVAIFSLRTGMRSDTIRRLVQELVDAEIVKLITKDGKCYIE